MRHIIETHFSTLRQCGKISVLTKIEIKKLTLKRTKLKMLFSDNQSINQ